MLSSLIGEYRGVFRFFKAYKKFWLILTVTAIVFSVVAYLLIWNGVCGNTDAAISSINSVNEIFEGKYDNISDSDGNITAIGLFKNNVLAMFLITILGLVPFLFIPAFALIINIVIICLTMASGISIGAFDTAGALLLLAPHGVFELPALLISSGFGIILCDYVSSRMTHRGQPPAVAANHLALELSRAFILVVVLLLIAASVAEAYLTPALFSLRM